MLRRELPVVKHADGQMTIWLLWQHKVTPEDECIRRALQWTKESACEHERVRSCSSLRESERDMSLNEEMKMEVARVGE